MRDRTMRMIATRHGSGGRAIDDIECVGSRLRRDVTDVWWEWLGGTLSPHDTIRGRRLEGTTPLTSKIVWNLVAYIEMDHRNMRMELVYITIFHVQCPW